MKALGPSKMSGRGRASRARAKREVKLNKRNLTTADDWCESLLEEIERVSDMQAEHA
jgi:hypothetical protein